MERLISFMNRKKIIVNMGPFLEYHSVWRKLTAHWKIKINQNNLVCKETKYISKLLSFIDKKGKYNIFYETNIRNRDQFSPSQM